MGIEVTDIKRSEEKRNDDSNDKPVQDLVEPNLKGDKLNVLLLIMLYMLQGIPMGIAMAIKMYMQNMKISYAEQVGTKTWNGFNSRQHKLKMETE